MNRRTWILTVVFAMVSQPAWAARTRMHDLAESPYYKEKAGGMIGRGVINVATCFVDPLVNIVNETKAGPPFIGTLTGVAKGLGCGVLRLGSGAVDVVTFWVPGFNGFPVSDSYENCLGPSGSPASMTPAGYGGSGRVSVPADEPEARSPVSIPAEPAKKSWSK